MKPSTDKRNKRTALIFLAALATLMGNLQNAAATYIPTQGRWLQRDPIGIIDGTSRIEYVGGSGPGVIETFDPSKQYTDGMSLYEYVAGNPTSATDSMGLIHSCGEGKVKRTEEDAWIDIGAPGPFANQHRTRIVDLACDEVFTTFTEDKKPVRSDIFGFGEAWMWSEQREKAKSCCPCLHGWIEYKYDKYRNVWIVLSKEDTKKGKCKVEAKIGKQLIHAVQKIVGYKWVGKPYDTKEKCEGRNKQG